MKKLFTFVLLSIILFGCHRPIYNPNNYIVRNMQESTPARIVYDLELKRDVTLTVYDIKNSHWNSIDSSTIEKNYSKLVIDIIEQTNDFNQQEYYLQYFICDNQGNECPEVYRYVYTNKNHLSLTNDLNYALQFDEGNAPLVMFKWGNDQIFPISEVDLTKPCDVPYAFLLVLN